MAALNCHLEGGDCETNDREKTALDPRRGNRQLPRLLNLIAILISPSILLAPAISRSEALAVEFGSGEDVRIETLDLDIDWCRSCRLAAPEHTSLAWELTAMAMQGHRAQEANDNLVALGAMPLLRYGWPERDGGLFVEDGVGVRLLSHTRLYNERQLSTAFQFGELLGIGFRFCRRNACEAGVRVQHISNADIKRPNDGVTFGAIRFAVHWD
ncbi:MAG TPA: acyloxyacyl hydrolase [Burkholderiaceae bacterium]|nr:acyloxyacyl hydrolase [Burkholderiaceae bacterium]